jgi:drug/metabolite transporter superfamily protein YnfA
MSVPDVLVILALVLFAVEEMNAKGRAIGWWGAILVCAALLWGTFIS